jgi:hypothetical protein
MENLQAKIERVGENGKFTMSLKVPSWSDYLVSSVFTRINYEGVSVLREATCKNKYGEPYKSGLVKVWGENEGRVKEVFTQLLEKSVVKWYIKPEDNSLGLLGRIGDRIRDAKDRVLDALAEFVYNPGS